MLDQDRLCITFYVSDLARAKNFYEEIIGLEKKYEFSSYVGFECGEVEIGLIPKAEGGKVIVDSSPSVEFLVSNVEKAYSELKVRGVNFVKELHDEPSFSHETRLILLIKPATQKALGLTAVVDLGFASNLSSSPRPLKVTPAEIY